MSKQVTIETLLKQKEKLQNKDEKKLALYIESLEGEIVIAQPDRALCLETITMTQNDATVAQADVHMVYNIVISPNLKDAELQKQFGCVEPTDIVDLIFEPGEVSMIAGYGLELAGYSSDINSVVRKVDRELKN